MRRRTKVIITCVLVILIAASSYTNTFAIMKVQRKNLYLTFDGNTAKCTVFVKDDNKNINVTMQLWQGGTLVATWNANGTSSVYLSKTRAVTSGKTYTLKAYGTIDGVAFQLTPITKTC